MLRDKGIEITPQHLKSSVTARRSACRITRCVDMSGRGPTGRQKIRFHPTRYRAGLRRQIYEKDPAHGRSAACGASQRARLADIGRMGEPDCGRRLRARTAFRADDMWSVAREPTAISVQGLYQAIPQFTSDDAARSRQEPAVRGPAGRAA